MRALRSNRSTSQPERWILDLLAVRLRPLCVQEAGFFELFECGVQRMLHAALKVVGGKQDGKLIPLTSAKFLIGREQDCHLRPSTESVSRHHCVINVDEFSVRVRDLGSSNGTMVNDSRIIGVHQVRPGDRLKIGSLEFQFVFQDVEVPAEAAVGVTPGSSAATLGGTEFNLGDMGLESLETVEPVADTAVMSGDTKIMTTAEAAAESAEAAGDVDAAEEDTSEPEADLSGEVAPAAFEPTPAQLAAAQQAAAQLQQPMMPPGQQQMPGNPYGMPGYPQGYPQQYGGMPGYPYPMPGYGMPQMPGYGMPQMPGYGMPQMPGYGMPYPQQMPQGYPQQQPAPQYLPSDDEEDDEEEAAPKKNLADMPAVTLPDPSETGVKAPPEKKPEEAAEAPKPKAPNPAEEILNKYRNRR